MEKRVASILLLLSVKALLVFGGFSAASSGDTDVIRLPSESEGNESPPWKCCNQAICLRIWPPRCKCMDRVEHCSSACKECVSVEGSSKVCDDWYTGMPPKSCDEHQDSNVVHVVVPEARKESDGERPWKCCNRPVIGPSTSETPVWYCLDKFEHCDCEHCSKVDKGHGYHCLDGYKGSNPGPSCTHDG